MRDYAVKANVALKDLLVTRSKPGVGSPACLLAAYVEPGLRTVPRVRTVRMAGIALAWIVVVLVIESIHLAVG